MRLRKLVLLSRPRAICALVAFLFTSVSAQSASAVTPVSVDWSRAAFTDRYNNAFGLAPDHQGNLYFAGNETPLANGNTWSFFLSKINSAGQTVWQQEIGQPTEFNSPAGFPSCLTMSSNGTVLLAGDTTESLAASNPNHFEEAVVMNYNAQGNRLWSWQLGGNQASYATTTSTDALGNVFVTGCSTEGVGGFLVKLNSSGTQLWRKDIGAYFSDATYHSALDAQGNIYVTGGTLGNAGGPSAGDRDVFLSKFNSAGTLQWTHQFGTQYYDQPVGLAIDAQGNLVLSSYIYDSFGSGSISGLLQKLDPAGNQLWVQQYLGNPAHMTLDSAGDIFIAGDPQLVEYNSAGSLIWTAPSSITNATGFPGVLTYDATDNHLYVGGIKNGINGNFNAYASRLTMTVPEPATIILAAFGLLPFVAIAAHPRRKSSDSPNV